MMSAAESQGKKMPTAHRARSDLWAYNPCLRFALAHSLSTPVTVFNHILRRYRCWGHCAWSYGSCIWSRIRASRHTLCHFV